MNKLIFPFLALTLVACQQAPVPESKSKPIPEVAKPATEEPTRIEIVLKSQPEDVQARYSFRHPQQTLDFFGIEPGQTVVEALPGSGWYSKILIDYLGPNGKLIGADYALEMYPKFGFFSAEQLDAKKTWVADWTAEANTWRDDDDASVSAFTFGHMPAEMEGTADVVLFIRALHNLARFEDDGQFLTAAANDAFRILKPGGIVGVVQHQAREYMPDDWAAGQAGYLKKSFVIGIMDTAGFELVGSSDINANSKDQPAITDVVWRLPPTLATSKDDPVLKAQLEAIGESNRMTLKFRKPK